MRAMTILSVRSPIAHPPAQPLMLPPQLDPSCVLCLLPVRDNKWVDYSGRGNHGSLVGASYTAKGRRGPAVYFGGANQYVDLGVQSSLQLTGDFTIALWVYRGVTGVGQCIFDNGLWVTKGYRVTLTSANRIQFYTFQAAAFQTSYSNGSIDTPNRWYHIAAVVRNTRGYTYYNGVDDTNTSSVHIDPVASDLETTLGIYKPALSNDFTGLIDECLVFTRALSAPEIKSLYEQGRR